MAAIMPPMPQQPPAHLHPVALRSQSTPSPAGTKAACDASAQLRDSTNLPAQNSAHAAEATKPVVAAVSSRRPSAVAAPQPPSLARAQEPQQQQQAEDKVFGLQHPHQLEEYRSHPQNSEIKLLTAHQYATLANQELAHDTPEQALFPWLHGADQTGTNQAYYFGCTPHNPCPPPRFRGLTTVSCDPPPGPPHARTKSFAESFQSSSSISSYASSSDSSSSFDDDSNSSDHLFNLSQLPFGPEPRPAQLLSSFAPEELLHKSEPVFAVPVLPPSQINLRNFKLQATKMASLSDIVVYAADGLSSPALLPTAERFLAAQKRTREQRAAECGVDPATLLQYSVFVVADRFDVFERRLPHLVAVSSNGFRRHRVDFFDQEKQEMRKLTQASPIADGVWLGNTGDVPLPQDMPAAASHTPRAAGSTASLDLALEQSNLAGPGSGGGRRTRLASSDSSSSLEQDTIEDGNPHKFGVCIEAHDQAVMPSHDDFKQINSYLARVDPKTVHTSQIVHIECSSSSQTCLHPGAVDDMVENMIHLVTWIRQQVKPAVAPASTFSVRGRRFKQPPAARQPRNVLLHTADGYTDTSLLALAYTMYDRHCTLPQAYLHLQNTCQRSFFVYPADVAFLGKLESRLAVLVAEERRAAALEDEADPPSPNSSMPSLLRHRFSRSASPATVALPNNNNSKTPGHMSALDRCLAAPWFYSDRFDGHFPSRILPFLYLGNINHASNALMLKELGITHVVSIGESALIPPKSPSPAPPAGVPASAKARLPTNSLWLEASLGHIQVLDLPGIADDGIDSIRPFMEISERFIEQARVSGGKVLVHCRVGVSRSATLVTAFVMKHMAMDLASAYLLVRARRLNILIQPTVPFFWSLQWYEAKLNRERAAQGLKPLGAPLSFGYLSRQLYIINQRYLGP